MTKVIVTTTINPPTEAIRKFDAMPDWTLVVVGDKKTPPEYHLDRGIYISPKEQEQYDPELSAAIGWNCIQRRTMGLLWAKEMKAEVVAVVDDDNIPLEGWGQNLIVGKTVDIHHYQTTLPVFDPVGATNYPDIWHRGFPLQLVAKRDYTKQTTRALDVHVQADFWNGDPDIDAICRMEHAPVCEFDPNVFPVASNKIGPFNSQNTFLSPECLKDYFLFPHIGRMDDIWASFYLQAKGYRVAWHKASVYQQRNQHDLIHDMKQEYLGYEHNLHLAETLAKDEEAILAFLPGSAVWALHLYRRHFSRA